MTPLTEAVIELRIVATKAEQAAARLGPTPRRGDIEDHRTAVTAELLDACDRFDPGLGTQLMLAMYPHTNGVRE